MGDIEHRHLRQALEFAMLMATEGHKRRPQVPYPKELKAFVGVARLPTGALGKIRRAVEGDADFRTRLSAGALPELVDEVGRLWLERPAGWAERVDTLIAEVVDEEATNDLRRVLRRTEKRRDAAEAATARVNLELLARDESIGAFESAIDELRTDLLKAADELAEVRAELVDTRNEVRHARDREQAAVARLDAAVRDRDTALAARSRAASVRDDALAARVETVGSVVEIEAAAQAAQSLANRLESLLPQVKDEPSGRRRPEQRSPLALPGGVLSSSAAAAEFFVRSDAAVLIDGYNVAMLTWSGRSLEQQRNLLLDAVENLARRHGTDITVVFDGASVVGAHAARRRLVRVVYSPDGVIADDVIRDEVRRLPTSRPVVVVTNDNEIVRDVRVDGANTVSSNALIAIM